jgi:hypothetical protein
MRSILLQYSYTNQNINQFFLPDETEWPAKEGGLSHSEKWH